MSDAASLSSGLIAGSVAALAAVGLNGDVLAAQKADVESVAELISGLKAALTALDHALEKAETDNLEKKATAFAYTVSDQMLAVREICDKLELIVDDGLWPLPKYREMLFLC